MERLGRAFKRQVRRLRARSGRLELVFLVDESSSVGPANFASELRFVKKLLSDFPVVPAATRVAIVTFSSRSNVAPRVDYISRRRPQQHKCALLGREIPGIAYRGGGTYTKGAFQQAAVSARGRMLVGLGVVVGSRRLAVLGVRSGVVPVVGLGCGVSVVLQVVVVLRSVVFHVVVVWDVIFPAVVVVWGVIVPVVVLAERGPFCACVPGGVWSCMWWWCSEVCCSLWWWCGVGSSFCWWWHREWSCMWWW